MELVKRNIHMDVCRCKASSQMTLEDDVIISDSRPDAAKLIMDRGNISIEEVKVTDDHVVVRGKLEFQVLYLAEKSTAKENRDIAEMPGSIPFEENVFMEGVKAQDSVNVCWEIEDLSISLINSRKIGIQSVVSLKLSCREICEEEAAVDLYSTEPVEFRKKLLDVATIAIKKKDLFRVKEEVEVPGSFPNIRSLIWSSVTPSQLEFKALEDKIAIQGELRAFFLYSGEGDEEELCHYETAIPFAGSLDCGGCREGMIPEIAYTPQLREVEARPDFDGEERVITFELCLDLDIALYEEEKTELLSDVYGVVKEVSAVEQDAAVCRLLCRSSGKAKLADHFRSEEEGVSIHKVLHTACELQVTEQSILENGMELSGVVRLRIFHENTNENNKYGVIKATLPFSHVLEAEGINEGCTYQIQSFVEQISVSVIDQAEVDVKCVLFFRANVFSQWKEKIVKEILISDPDPEKMAALPGIAVYMVKDGESLWDIGKRYYVPVSVLKQTNELADDQVRAGDKILIVKGF